MALLQPSGTTQRSLKRESGKAGAPFMKILLTTQNAKRMTNPIAILAILTANVFIAHWLERLPYFKHISAALLIILLGAIEANVGIIPSSTQAPPLYDGIFAYLSPLMIIFLMLGIQLKSLKKAGFTMIATFLGGALSIMLGTGLGMWFVDGRTHLGDTFNVIGGMYTATYIGGSTNMNAIALTYDFAKEGTLYAAISAVDNVVTALWLAATIVIPRVMSKLLPTRRQGSGTQEGYETQISEESTINPSDLGILIALGCATLYVAGILSAWYPVVHRIIWLSTIALLLAQLPIIQKLRGSRTLGMFCSYLFLSVIGAYCDLPALFKDLNIAWTLIQFVTILFTVHTLMFFGIGYLFKLDWDIMGIASQANVGGAPTALSVAKSLGREDLGLGAILIGLLGNAVGTYCGLMMAELLKIWF
jgi:uncharacterized membrane protein